METFNKITKLISDIRYCKDGSFLANGKFHNKNITFVLKKFKSDKSDFRTEDIYFIHPRSRKQHSVQFNWLIGGYNIKGEQTVGIVRKYGENLETINIELKDLIKLLEELDSEIIIQSWKKQLK